MAEKDITEKIQNLQHVEAVLQLLSVMTGDTRFEEVLNQKDETGRGGVRNMCEVLDKVEARGIAKGEVIGAIKVYRDDLHLTPAEIVEKIVTRFHLKRDEAKKYVEETLRMQPV